MLHANKTFVLNVAQDTAVGFLDIRLMERVLDNLVNNALRFCRDRIVITLSSDDSSACLQVDDDGPGIAPEDAENIFEPFIRLEAGLGNSSGGCGLGLAIVHAIVQAYDGTISVERSAWGGACFCFKWPIKTQTTPCVTVTE